jgi:acrylyl-CoA reductase (NADPH)
MTAIPARFRAYVAEKVDDRVARGVRDFAEPDLPPGEIEIRVGWSSVNYMDGLATRVDG